MPFTPSDLVRRLACTEGELGEDQLGDPELIRAELLNQAQSILYGADTMVDTYEAKTAEDVAKVAERLRWLAGWASDIAAGLASLDEPSEN